MPVRCVGMLGSGATRKCLKLTGILSQESRVVSFLDFHSLNIITSIIEFMIFNFISSSYKTVKIQILN